LPVFDQNQAQTAKARFLHTQQQKNYEQLLLTVAREVLDAASNARATADQLKLIREQALPLAEKNAETAQRIYEAGEESILVLMLAQQTCSHQREMLASLTGDWVIAQVELERVIGGKSECVPVDTAP
jgi:outer membrane protein TolC